MGKNARILSPSPEVAPQQWPASEVSMWAIDRLIPYARNARTHSEAQVAQLASSIQEFGWTIPVLVDEAGGLIAGHGRLLAAQQLGIAECPVMVARGWPDAKKRAYILTDNKLALNAGWNDELLAVELDELRDLKFDMSLMGFTPQELNDLIGTPNTGPMPNLPDGDKAPFQQMTFTLHDTQAEQVSAAMDAAKQLGPFVDSPNENGNGNALARICETFLTQHANG